MTLVGLILAITATIQSEEIYRIVVETNTYLVDKKVKIERIFSEQTEKEISAKLDLLRRELHYQQILSLPPYYNNEKLRN